MIWTNSYYEFIIYSLRFDKKKKKKKPSFCRGCAEDATTNPTIIKVATAETIFFFYCRSP
jgi:transaldolase